MIPLLAHGALGYNDEAFAIGLVLVVVLFLAISWHESRQIEDE